MTDRILYTETFPLAKTPHKCCECRRQIAAGEYYHHVSGRWDGDFLRFKTCWQCQTMRLYLLREASEFWREPWCIAFGDLREEWREYFGAPLGQCSPDDTRHSLAPWEEEQTGRLL